MARVSQRQLSPNGAFAASLLFAFSGGYIVLRSLGMLPPGPDPRIPAWVATVAGLMFIFAGISILNGSVIAGGAGPDGDLRPGTPFAVRLIQYLLGLSVCGALSALFLWTAFGPGERKFSMTLSLPFLTGRAGSNETLGRMVFGAGALMIVAISTALAVRGARRLRTSRRRRR